MMRDRLPEVLSRLDQAALDAPTSEVHAVAGLMVEALDIALHGASWARPQPPRNVWRQLLAEVEALATAEHTRHTGPRGPGQGTCPGSA